MKTTLSAPLVDLIMIPTLPDWIRLGRACDIEGLAHLSGAALAHLHLVVTQTNVPQALWRARLALSSAEACVRISGRPERMADLRDALCLLRPGDQPGPGGEVFRQWSRAVERPVSVAGLCRALPKVAPENIEHALDTDQGDAVGRAAKVIEAVLTQAPHAHVRALILGEAVLARALGWEHLLPILALGLNARDLRKTGAELRGACHRALVSAAPTALQMAGEFACRAARLRSIQPKLRAKGAARAVERFLTQDALPSSALVPVLSDRAARRLCDRLVALGAVQELTGRDTFRLYGL